MMSYYLNVQFQVQRVNGFGKECSVARMEVIVYVADG